MTETTTIQVPIALKERLGGMKLHPRETYADVLERLLEDLEELGPETTKAVEKAHREFKQGKARSLDDVKRRMGL